jgi:single-strand DNA-binding protein
MADLNKVFLMGRLTFDPELRRTPSGMAVSELRMATSRTWMGRDGERKEETLFIDVSVWDRQAENCCQYLKKGSAIHVEGSLKMDTWDDKTTGEKRTKIKVHADRVQFLDRREPVGMVSDDDYAPPPARESAPRRMSSGAGEGKGEGGGPSRAFNTSGASPAPRRPAPATEPENNSDEDEDIPF